MTKVINVLNDHTRDRHRVGLNSGTMCYKGL